jgi:hypothetical protein
MVATLGHFFTNYHSGQFGPVVSFRVSDLVCVVLDFSLYYLRSLEDRHATRKNWHFNACFRIPPYALARLAHCECPKRR